MYLIIEMIFDEKRQAVDWIFRYGNPALSKLEKMPLERLIGSSFGSLFSNMDSKCLRSYERATLYGETLEIIDYSPKIDTYLKVICFPTFKGHCGCILFNISEIKFTKNSSDAEKALMLYFGKLPDKNVWALQLNKLLNIAYRCMLYMLCTLSANCKSLRRCVCVFLCQFVPKICRFVTNLLMIIKKSL